MALKVNVIVLCYNDVDSTLACLASLTKQNYSPLEILVVDNNSHDGTINKVSQAFPEIPLISTGDNLGYAQGNNLGIEEALKRDADLIFLVNNDTRLDPNCVLTLVRSLEAHPQTGIIGPMVYTWDSERIISSAGGQIDWPHADAINVGMGKLDEGQYPARPVDFINGCGLMVTRQAIARAGTLDSKFFMYWEETDWCQRVKKAGFEILFEPEARMQHKASIKVQELSPTTLYYVSRNRLLFFGRHAPLPVKALALSQALWGLLYGIMLHRRAGRPVHVRATQLAILHALQGHWGRIDPVI